MTAIELRNVRKRYPKVSALQGIDLSLKQGQFLVLLGPPNSGKTTLLRLLAGLEKINSGEIFFADKRVNRFSPAKRKVSMVFQNAALYPHMTISENLLYGIKKVDRAGVLLRLEEVVTSFHLKALLEKRPDQLTPAQRQTIAIARALIRPADLLLLDDPLLHFDAIERTEMRLALHRLTRKFNLTTICATKHQADAMMLSDVLAIMNHGLVEQVGKPLDLYYSPASRFVASYLGSPCMSFIPVEVCNEGSSVMLSDSVFLPLPKGILKNYEGEQVTLGIRPEALSVAQTQDEHSIRIRIHTVEALGADTIVYGCLPNGQQLSAKLPGYIRTHAGEFIVLSAELRDIHFFDPRTGVRLMGFRL